MTKMDHPGASPEVREDAHAVTSEPAGADGGLFPQFPAPLRRHMHFIEAALSTYWGGPASEDVRHAWRSIIEAIPCEPEVNTGDAEPSAQWARDLLAEVNAGGPVIVGSSGSVFIRQDVAVAALMALADQSNDRAKP